MLKRKARWQPVHQTEEVIEGLPLLPSIAVQTRYTRLLEDLVTRMADGAKRELLKLFQQPHAEEYFAQDMSISAQASFITRALITQFSRLFSDRAHEYATQFVTQSDTSAKQSVQASVNHMTGGQSLSIGRLDLTGPMKEVFTASVAENVSLIKSIASQYLASVQSAVMRSITTGNGLQDLVPFLVKQRGVTLRRARFIAKDQTKKAFENLTSVRMEKLGIDDFKWMHSQGGNHPRPFHKNVLNGQIFSLSKPPYDPTVNEHVLPGQLPGCKCFKKPVSRFLNYT